MFRTYKCSSSDLHMQFYGIPFMHPYMQSGPSNDQTAYMDAWNKYHKTARTSLPEDEHLYVTTLFYCGYFNLSASVV